MREFAQAVAQPPKGALYSRASKHRQRAEAGSAKNVSGIIQPIRNFLGMNVFAAKKCVDRFEHKFVRNGTEKGEKGALFMAVKFSCSPPSFSRCLWNLRRMLAFTKIVA